VAASVEGGGVGGGRRRERWPVAGERGRRGGAETVGAAAAW
jgi:hypothetical protein